MLQLVRAGLRSGHPRHRLVLFALRLVHIRVRSLWWELAGTIVDLRDFHRRDRSTDLAFVVHHQRLAAGSFYEAGSTDLWRRFLADAGPRLIRSRLGYRLHAGELRRVVALEPFVFAPPIRFRAEHRSVLSIFDVIDKAWLSAHLAQVGADVIVTANVDSVTHVPSLAALSALPWYFLPWSVPDEVPQRWSRGQLTARVVTVGAAGPMYTLRNWVAAHPRVAGHIRVSSYESATRTVDRDDYFALLAAEPAVVVAFGDEERHRIPVAKYVEVPAVGSLLIAARAARLEEMGFEHGLNCLMFEGREDFEACIERFLADPAAHLPVARRGQQLVRERHATSVRIGELLALLAPKAQDRPER